LYLVVDVAAQVPAERDVAAFPVDVEQAVVVAGDQRVLYVGVRSLVGVAGSQRRDHVTGSGSVPQHDVRVLRARVLLDDGS